MLRALKQTLKRRAVAFLGLKDIADEVAEIRKICTTIQYQTTVAPDGLPIPPPEMHYLVSGNRDLDVSGFLEIGRRCAARVTGLLEKHAQDIERFQAILDFGCGCGRVLRHFHALKNAKMVGTDLDATLIDWCRKNLTFGEFGVNELKPPLAYGDAKFDLIYAFSVFTHVPESLQLPWLAELGRVLKPGGYLSISTHGDDYAEHHLSPSDKYKYRSGQVVVNDVGSPGENIYSAYHPLSYVKEAASRNGFEVLDFVPGTPVDVAGQRLVAQDVYFMRKIA